jgi:hypothetical protein
MDNRGGGGVLLDRFDAFNTRRLGFIRLACGDDFPVTGFEVEPVLFFPVKENFKLCCPVELLYRFDYTYFNTLKKFVQGQNSCFLNLQRKFQKYFTQTFATPFDWTVLHSFMTAKFLKTNFPCFNPQV